MNPKEKIDPNNKVELLKKIPLLSNIGPSHREQLASTSEVSTFTPGQTLFRQGDTGKGCYIIIDGEAQVITEGPEGEVAVATLGQYQFIGEIAILIDVPRTATVFALSDLTTLMISKEMFYRITTEFPDIGIEVMRELARRLYKTTVQVSQLGGDSEPIQFSG